MKFKWAFIGFVLVASAAFALLLPYAYSMARALRECRRQFPADLVELEQRIRLEQWDAVYASASRDLRARVGRAEFAGSRALEPPAGAIRLKIAAEPAALRSAASWVDADDEIVGHRLIFVWQDGRNRLDRVGDQFGTR